jgi:hypothetical protein
MQSQTNVVLVHGVSADASSLKRFNVTAVQLPLTSLTDDITVTQVPGGPKIQKHRSLTLVVREECLVFR